MSAVGQTLRGIRAALRAHKGIVVLATLRVSVFNLFVPVVILSIARKPADFFTFNPWLRRLPDYLASGDDPWTKKLDFLTGMALAWTSANSDIEGVEWGVIYDVPTLAQILATSF